MNVNFRNIQLFVWLQSESVVNFGNAERENANFNQSLSTSMTINTKAAMNVIQQMWESPSTRQGTGHDYCLCI